MKRIKIILGAIVAILLGMLVFGATETLATNTRTLSIRSTRPYVTPNRAYNFTRGGTTHHLVKIFDRANAHTGYPVTRTRVVSRCNILFKSGTWFW